MIKQVLVNSLSLPPSIMFPPSTATKISNDHVDHLVKSILNRREKKLREQQQTFIRRNTDENNKRDNYLIDKFTMKKKSSKENIEKPPKKKTPIPVDDDDDFVSIKKPPVKIPTHSFIPKIDPIRACLESIITQIENDEATCPICNQILSNFPTIDQRERHVNQCLEESQIKTVNSSSKLHNSILDLSFRSKQNNRQHYYPIQSLPHRYVKRLPHRISNVKFVEYHSQ